MFDSLNFLFIFAILLAVTAIYKFICETVMKKMFLFLSSVLFIPILVSAQSITMQCGVAQSSLDVWYPGFDTKISNPTFLVGMQYGLPFLPEKYLNLASNVGYIRKGGEGIVTSFDENGIALPPKLFKLRYDYISINTCLEANLPIGTFFKPFLSAGPRIDFLVKATADGQSASDRNAVSYGAILGGGFKFDLGLVQLGARGDYYLNFNSIYDSNGFTEKDKTYTLTAFVGVKISR